MNRVPGTVRALLAAALLARLCLASAQDLTRTESWSVGRATAECAGVGEVIATARGEDVHPPLYYLALYGLERAVGLHVFPLKAFHAATAVLAIALLWGWVREAAGSGPAFWAAFLAAASGYHLMLSVQMRMYMLNAVWITAAFWAAWRFWHGSGRVGRGTPAAFAVAILAALHTHYYALFAWGAVLAATAPESLRFSERRRDWWIAQGVVLAGWLPWAVWGLAHQLGEGRTATVSPEGAAWIGELASAPIRFFVMNVRAASPAAAAAAALFVAAGYAAAFLRLKPPCAEKSPTTAAGSWILFLVILAAVPLWLAASYSLWKRPIWGLHYAIVAFPAFCALAGTGIARLPRGAALAGGIVLLAAGGISLPAIAAQGNPAYRESVRIVLAEGGLSDAIIMNAMPHSGEGFLHFLRVHGGDRRGLALFSVHEDPTYDDVPWLTRWRAWDDPPRAAGEAAGRIRELLARHRHVWFLNFSHAQGAFAALERRIATDFSFRAFDAGTARLFLIEGDRAPE